MHQPVARRRAQRGQTLVIFALIAVVLFAVVGLAVDGGFSYFASDRLERGAMAAALAGVPDMPDFAGATVAANIAANKNGWTTGAPNNVQIDVARVNDPDTGLPAGNRLAVTITSDVPVFFMKLLGFGTHREARTVIAEYLRPITFGQPGAQLGSALDELGSANSFYFMRSEGWGTDRGQGDPYGPNPADWGGASVSAPPDTHSLSSNLNSEATLATPIALPARGGQNYQIYIPAGQTGTVQVYNPVFAPDNGAVSAKGYNFHEDDTDFPEAPPGCSHGTVSATFPTGQGTAGCLGPSNNQQWPVMSYTLYQSPNPFDHTADTWVTNLTVQSIDATANPATSTYTIPKSGVATTYPTATSGVYHKWVDIANPPVGAQDVALDSLTKSIAGFDTLTGAAGTGTTFRLRVDQLDNASTDPGANGRAQLLNSQAHKAYAVRVLPNGSGCAGCSVTALNDVTLYTPVKGGGFSMPLVSIPPEYNGRTFSLYVFDPGDVQCVKPNQCTNVITVLRPNGVTGGVANPEVAASNTDGVFSGGSSEQSAFSLVTAANNPSPPTVGGAAALETQNKTLASGNNIYNGKWVRFDVAVPGDYKTKDVTADPATWFWQLSYTTALTSSDTFSANLGFTGAPVHIISG